MKRYLPGVPSFMWRELENTMNNTTEEENPMSNTQVVRIATNIATFPVESKNREDLLSKVVDIQEETMPELAAVRQATIQEVKKMVKGLKQALPDIRRDDYDEIWGYNLALDDLITELEQLQKGKT